MLFMLTTTILVAYGYCEKLNTQPFPEDFLFGVTSSAYQIEGSPNADGKAPNVWDVLNQNKSDTKTKETNPSMMCDSYRQFQTDISLLKDLGVNVYKFSISMSRVMPEGKMNHDGLDYYNKLIDGLVANGIKPMVTLFHWDTPLSMQQLGGWVNPYIQNIFVEYAKLVFETFGDRVKHWITFNDPGGFCLRTHMDDSFPPSSKNGKFGVYLCSYVILKAHAAVYRIYAKNYRSSQKGKISISLDALWFEPATTNPKDVEVTEAMFDFTLGQFANPIFLDGEFPEIMRTTINKKSLSSGFLLSRLPKLNHEESEMIRGSADFFALNFYTSMSVFFKDYATEDSENFYNDVSSNTVFYAIWNATCTQWIQPVPSALRKMLKFIKEKYGDIPIYITENGFPDSAQTEDYDRIFYIQTYLSSILDTIIEDDVNVIGYNVRSFMDSFVWTEGFDTKFGLYQVNFEEKGRPRTPKLSSVAYKEIIRNRKLPSHTTNKP